MNTKTKKSFLPYRLLLVLAMGAMVFAISGCSNQKNADVESKNSEYKNLNSADKKSQDMKNDGGEFTWPSTSAKYITAVPVDLSQIQSISKYRSCAGHDRSGYSFEQILETDRSMKHYFYPVPEFQGTIDAVKMFAPFDGTVVALDWEKDKVGGRPQNGNGIHISTSADPSAMFGFGHIYFAKDFNIGDTVKAGQLIGYAALGDTGNDFDLDLDTLGGTNAYNGKEVLGSVFDHMTDSVLAEFAKYGVTPENTKFTKQYRDADPCNYPDTSAKHHGRENEDWVQLDLL